MDPLEQLTVAARANAGVITRAEALDAGVRARDLTLLVASGAVARIARGIYLVGDPLPDPHRIASSWRAVISFESAAAWHGVELARPLEKIHVTVARRRGRWAETVPEVRLHRADIAPWDVQSVRGALVTSPLRTAIDIARHAPVDDAVAVIDGFLRARKFTPTALLGAAARAKGPGRLRIQVVAALIDPFSGSVLESLTRTLLWREGLPKPVTQLRIRDKSTQWIGRVDFAWPDRRVVLECDGYAYHSSQQQYQRDRRRWSSLSAAGWRPGIVTWFDVTRNPNYVVRLVSDLLELGALENTNGKRVAS